MGTKNGFTIIETLFSIMISTIVLTVIISALSLINNLKLKSDFYADIYIMSKQLQSDLSCSYNITGDASNLYYEKDNNKFHIYLNDNRIVRGDGFEILLFDVDELTFIYDEYLKLVVKRSNQEFELIQAVLRHAY